MNKLNDQFLVKNYEEARTNKESIILGKHYRISILSDVLVRLEWSNDGKFEDRPTELVKFRNFQPPKYFIKEDKDYLTVSTNYFKLEYQKNKPFYGGKMNPDINFRIVLNNSDKVWFFGCAEARNFNGTAYSLDDSDGRAKFDKGLYSTDGFVSIDDAESLILNVDGSFTKRSDKRVDTYVFMYRKDFGFCLRDYFKLTGKAPLIPRYALGNWWNKNIAYTSQDIEKITNEFKYNDIPLSVLLLNDDWHIKHEGTNTGFTFDYKKIDNPKELTNNLHDKGIYLGLSINPMEGISPDEIAYSRFKEHIKYEEDGIIPFNVYNNDIINAYFDEFIKPLYEIGTDFFWIDYNNENNKQMLRLLNRYHYEDFNRLHNKRGLILSRNGGIASHNYPILYSGQTVVSWKTLDLLPEFNSKASNIGISYWSHDIGGYKQGVEDPELYMRYVQFGTFSPILRFSSDTSHYYKREPWLWDVKTYLVAKEYLQLRHRLIPYIYTECFKYSKTGLPLIQPIYYRYPEIYDEVDYKNEYYFGSELFICPITTKKNIIMNRTVQRIFLPNGIWYDFKTGKKFMGGKRYVSFYEDEDYPVFAKQGTIIPMAILDKDNINDTTNPKEMEIYIFPGRSNTYKLYEDDGVSLEYKNDLYLITDIDYNYQRNNFTVIIRPTAGTSKATVPERHYKIRFRNVRKPSDVIVYIGKEKTSEFKYFIDGNDLIVDIPKVLTNEQLSINCKGKDIEIEAERIINEDLDSILSDLQINTDLKEKVAAILFSEDEIKRKRINIRKLRRKGLHPKYVTMFLKLLEYIAEL